MDLLRTGYRTRVRFYRDDPGTTEILWYRVPEDRLWLPVPTIYSSYNWDNPNSNGRTAMRGTIFQGEQVDADRPSTNGFDPFHTMWQEGVYQGTREQWAGADLVPKDFGPLATLLPKDCCGHFPVGERCGEVFFPGNGPSAFEIELTVTATDPNYQDLPGPGYTLDWGGLTAPCIWGLSLPVIPPTLTEPLKLGVEFLFMVSSTSVSLLVFDSLGFLMVTYGVRKPRNWTGLTPVILDLSPGLSLHYNWPPTITAIGVP